MANNAKSNNGRQRRARRPQQQRKPARQMRRRPRRAPARQGPSNGPNSVRRVSRQPKRQGAMCHFQGTERVKQVNVPTTVTPGTLLFLTAVNPTVSPRLSAAASQFDSWYGTMTLEVETTGNSFSQDYVILRHVPNGDPTRLPVNNQNLLNLAEACDRPSESYKLQLDSNRIGRVTAPWGASYNPRKPILDADPSDCNNGLFIIVADGSPGANAVNLTVRLSYDIHFYGPVAVPVVVNSSQGIKGSGGQLNADSLFGTTPVLTGPGTVTAAGKSLTFTETGKYTVLFTATGQGLAGPPAGVISSGGSIDAPGFNNSGSTLSAIAAWNITVRERNTTFTIAVTSPSLTSTYTQVNPYVISY